MLPDTKVYVFVKPAQETIKIGGLHVNAQIGPNATEQDVDWCYKSLANLVADPRFGKPGYRNDSIVDFDIYCSGLGIDPEAFLLAMEEGGWIDLRDYDACMEKLKIVDHYVGGWWDSRAIGNYIIGTIGTVA